MECNLEMLKLFFFFHGNKEGVRRRWTDSAAYYSFSRVLFLRKNKRIPRRKDKERAYFVMIKEEEDLGRPEIFSVLVLKSLQVRHCREKLVWNFQR